MAWRVPAVASVGAGATVVLAAVLAVVTLSDDPSAPRPVTPPQTAEEVTPAADGAFPHVPADAPPVPPGARLRFADLGQPSTNPAGCAPVRERVAALIEELRPKLSADDLAAAQEAIQDVQARGQGPAEGYSAFAGGALLSGSFTAAAWGGLHAVRLEWRSDFVANAGVYLYYLDRLDDAEMFLACARELDPRSPFVIEAQAMLALRRKDCDRATRLIVLAVQLLPGDMNVLYSAAIIHHECGDRPKAVYYLRAAERAKPDDETVKRALRVVDPNAADRPRPRDALDRLIDECFAFLDETEARTALASDYLNLMMRAMSSEWVEDHDRLAQMREHVEQNKREIRDLEEQARDTRFGPPDPHAWNQTVEACARAYGDAVLDYENVFTGTSAMLIMGWAFRMDPLVYATRYAYGGGNDLDYVELDADDRFMEAIKPLDDRLGSCVSMLGDDDPCFRAFCAAAVPLWQEYRAAVDANCNTAKAGFPGAAEDYANYWLWYVRRVADFDKRAIDIIKPMPASPGAARQHAESIARIGQIQIDGLVEFVTIQLTGLYGSLQYALEEAPQAVTGAGQWEFCAQDGSDGKPMDEQLDPFLEALKAATKLEYGMGIDCESKIGGFGFALKGKTFADVQITRSEKAGKLTVSGHVRGDGRFGGEISYSQSAGGGSHGVVGKGSVKVYAKAGSDGRIDYGAQVEGKLGAGVNFKGVEVACYPFSGKVSFNARAFADAL